MLYYISGISLHIMPHTKTSDRCNVLPQVAGHLGARHQTRFGTITFSTSLSVHTLVGDVRSSTTYISKSIRRCSQVPCLEKTSSQQGSRLTPFACHTRADCTALGTFQNLVEVPTSRQRSEKRVVISRCYMAFRLYGTSIASIDRNPFRRRNELTPFASLGEELTAQC